MTKSPRLFAPADITLPEPGSETTRAILTAYLRRQFAAINALPFETVTGSPLGAEFQAQLRELSQKEPGLVFAILRRPTIGGLLRLIITRDGNTSEFRAWAKEIIAQFLMEMAAFGQASGTAPAGGAYEKLVSLQAGKTLVVPPEVETITFEGSKILFDGGQRGSFDLAAPGPEFEDAYPQVWEGVMLATYDNNPRAGVEAHPDKSGNHVDLGIKSAQDWVDGLQGGLRLIDEFLPSLIPEIELIMHQFVPVGFEPEKQLSASMRELIGNIYLSLHPDPIVMAEAIVHEFSHNKLNMLWSLNPLLVNAFEPLYSSPVRPDPRPLFGVLLAAHAFLPVETMYLAMRDAEFPATRHPRFITRLGQVRKANKEAVETVLENGIPTEAGKPLMEEMRRLEASLAARY